MAAPAPQDLPNKKGKGKGTYQEFGGEKVYIPPESESEYESETDSNGDFVDKRTDKQKAKDLGYASSYLDTLTPAALR